MSACDAHEVGEAKKPARIHASVRIVGRRQRWNSGAGKRSRHGHELATDAPFTWQVIVSVTFEPSATDVRAATKGLTTATLDRHTTGMPPVPEQGPDTVCLMGMYDAVCDKPSIRILLEGTGITLTTAVPRLPDMFLTAERKHDCPLCNGAVLPHDYVAGCGHWFHTACVCVVLGANGDTGFSCPACGKAVEDVIA